MIQLKNISKYYASKDVVSLGLRKVNTTLEIGEFVAVTGESGSGKSTFLNVISGMDSYEEGEMTVFGEETSGYTEQEWERYRNDYIAFVFQDYNLIDSYTVMQNIEVALINRIPDRVQRRARAKELISQVGLSGRAKSKASKLSGGEKQRVVIARALAIDAPVILADEPTGNLDSKTGNEILRLLNELSKDKLVVVVTHNYSQVEQYSTRKLRFFDGELVEDRVIKRTKKEKAHLSTAPSVKRFEEITNLTRVASANVFAAPKRSFFVFALLLISVFVLFNAFAPIAAQQKMGGMPVSGNFNNVHEKRVVVKNSDISKISEVNINKIQQLSGADALLVDDLVLEGYVNLRLKDVRYNSSSYFTFSPMPLSALSHNATLVGRKPAELNEVVLFITLENQATIDLLLEKTLINDKTIDNLQVGLNYSPSSNFSGVQTGENTITQSEDIPIELKVVGYYISETTYPEEYIFIDDMLLNSLAPYGTFGFLNSKISLVEGEEANIGKECGLSLKLSEAVPLGQAKVLIGKHSEELNILPMWSKIETIVPQLYDKVTLKIGTSLFSATSSPLTVTSVELSEGPLNEMYINPGEIEVLMSNNIYQVTIFVSVDKIDSVITALNSNGFSAYYPRKVIDLGIVDIIQNIFNYILFVVSAVVINALMYFVTRRVMDSKKKDYVVLRSMGLQKGQIKTLLLIENLLMAVVAYLMVVTAILVMLEMKVSFLRTFVHLSLSSYIVVFAAVILLSILLCNRYASKMFQSTVKQSLRQN